MPQRGRGALYGDHVAVVARRGRLLSAEPIFERGPAVGVDRGGGVRDMEGRIAFVRFGGGRAKVLRQIGRPDVARDVAAALLWEKLGWRGFRNKIEAAAEEAATTARGRGPRRRDLTDLPTFTVDPASARDFDDAVSARREGDGVRLWIHIADVAAHVAPGSPLDTEAAGRANSTYVPGTVEPMLPGALSSDACSLVPGAERLAVTTEIEFGPQGEPRSTGFYRSLIRSDHRLDYDQLDEVFAGSGRAPEHVAEPLAIAREVAAALGERRGEGALVVDSREPEFAFDSEGHVTGAHGVPQTEAHRLIEHLMVCTNEQVATLLEQRRVPAPYRVHEEPDPPRVERLLEQLESLDLPTPPLPHGLGPREAGELTGEASRLVAREAARRGHGRSAYTSLVLRALKQAHYSDRNVGHAGLASSAYCHFTSPIRRYADLVAHRGLLAAVGEGEDAPSRDTVRAAALQCSERERESSRLERDADDVCAAFLLERELFEHGHEERFEGEVSGVIGAGAFVGFGGRLGDVYEGFLPARRLRGERFDLNETETALVGGRTGRALRMGDPVEVTVARVEAHRGRVDLEPADG